MGFSLYNMFKAGLLLTNAVAILHPKVSDVLLSTSSISNEFYTYIEIFEALWL